MSRPILSKSYTSSQSETDPDTSIKVSTASSSDPETSSLVGTTAASEQESTSEERSGQSSPTPAMKSRQNRDQASIMANPVNNQGSETPQAPMTGTSPILVPRLTGHEKRQRYRQTHNDPSYQRKTEINKIKTVTQNSVASTPPAPVPDSRWDRFTQSITKDGALWLDGDIDNQVDMNELAAWLRTSPSNLRELKFFDLLICDADATALADALRENTSLTDLGFSSTNISADGIRALADALKVNKTLRQLDISFNSVGHQGATCFADALKINTTLSILNLGHCEIGNTGIIALSEILKFNTSLTSLIIYGNQIDEAGAIVLAQALEINKSLIKLDLGTNSIGSEGAKALAEALQVNSTLTHLKLDENNIDASGISALALALQENVTLKELNIMWNEIDHEGAKALADALQHNATLVTLQVAGHECSDSIQIPLIDALKFNESLTRLDVGEVNNPKLQQEKRNLLDRNKDRKLWPYAEASLDLLVRHSPMLSHIPVPTDVILLLTKQLSNQVLANFANEWETAFRESPSTIATTTTTTNTTTTTTTTTTINPTVRPTTSNASPATLATIPALAPLPMAEQTATAAEIQALLDSPNPVVALSRWIDGHENPATALYWIDPDNGYTLLHYAVAANQGAVIRHLIERGIDRTKVNHHQQTAAQLAQQKASSSSSQAAAKIVQLLG